MNKTLSFVTALVTAMIVSPTATGSAQSSPREALRVTSFGGEGSKNSVSDVEVGRGVVIALHPGERSLSILDSTGSFLRSVGREGSGPGEFRFPGQAGWVGDTLTVWDPALRRLSRFTNDGVFLNSSVVQASRSLYPLSGRRYLVESQGQDPNVVALAVIDSSGKLLRSLGSIPQNNRILTVDAGGRQLQSLQPFADFDLWAANPKEGVVIVDRSPSGSRRFEILITMISLAGDTIYSTPLSFQPLQLTDAIVEEIVDKMLQGLGSLQNRPAGITNSVLKRNLYRPSFLPPVTAVAISNDREVWLRMAGLPSEKVNNWIVLDSNGSKKRQLDFPATFEVRRVYDNSVWGVQVDPSGVQSLSKYLIN